MIEHRPEGLALSGTVLRALLAFTVKDTHKPLAERIAIENGDVCASDGGSAVRFVFRAGEGPSLREHEGKAWTREAVDHAIAWAKEHSESGRFQLDERTAVVLPWGSTVQGWYPLSKVEPPEGVNLTESVTIAPELFSKLELVARACRRIRDEGETADGPVIPNARLVSAGGPFDALRFVVGDEAYFRPSHEAVVSIMPSARPTAAQVKLAKRAASELERKVKKKRTRKSAKASEGAST